MPKKHIYFRTRWRSTFNLFQREVKVYYVSQVLKQGINIKTNCPNYILHNLGVSDKIETYIENQVC